MDERRGYDRLEVEGNVMLGAENNQLALAQARLDNISFGGFAIYSQQRIDIDKLVGFELATKVLSQPLIGKGRVRHLGKPTKLNGNPLTIGIEFIDINKDILLHIINRIQARIINELRHKKKIRPLDFIPY